MVNHKLEKQYTCPACGHIVFNEPPGSYDICPICYWEDDLTQLENFDVAGGANHMSLIEAQNNYESIGAIEERLKQYVQKANKDDKKDPTWRKINLRVDKIYRSPITKDWYYFVGFDKTRGAKKYSLKEEYKEKFNELQKRDPYYWHRIRIYNKYHVAFTIILLTIIIVIVVILSTLH